MYTVCTVRIRPIRAQDLKLKQPNLPLPADVYNELPTQPQSAVQVKNPMLVAQIKPWKKTRKTGVLVGGGANPRWLQNTTAVPTERRSGGRSVASVAMIDRVSRSPSVVTRKSVTEKAGGSLEQQQKFHVDLPYYGHPLPGQIPSVTLMLVDCPDDPTENEEEDTDVDQAQLDSRNGGEPSQPVLIGRASFDLRPYLSQNKNELHGLTFSLQDNQGNYAGKLICTLQFVLTGTVRVTVLNGTRLRSNVTDHDNPEPYVQAKLYPTKRRSKWKKTSHQKGENPEWGKYSRTATLTNIYNSFAYFPSSRRFEEDNEEPSGTNRARVGRQQLVPRNLAKSNVLEFRFKDEDRSQIPRVLVSVMDKMDTPSKRNKEKQQDQERIRRIEKQIKSLRLRKQLDAEKDGSPATPMAPLAGQAKLQATSVDSAKNSTGFFNLLFSKSKLAPGSPRGSTTRRRAAARKKQRTSVARMQEMNLKAPSTEPAATKQPVDPSTTDDQADHLDQPLSKEEGELLARLTKASKQLAMASQRMNNRKDRYIGSGSIDLRQFLTYDGVREAQYITVDISDDNGLGAGQVFCMIEFENSSYDPAQEIIKIPNFSWSKLNAKDIMSLSKMSTQDFVMELRKIYIYFDLNLDLHAPNFVIQTSNQTGMPKLVVFGMFLVFNTMLLVSIWYGFGNKFMSYIIGVLYPTYESFKALERKNTDLNTQWLTYWIIYGMFNFFENTILLPLIFVYPSLFYLFKILFLLWLVNPRQLGASMIYILVIAPLMRTYQKDIDTYISVFGQTTANFVKDFAGFYDQIEQEISFARDRNLINSKDYFSNDTMLYKNERAESMFQQTQQLKVLVVNEADKKKRRLLTVTEDMTLEDILIEACTKVNVDNFDDYELLLEQPTGDVVPFKGFDDFLSYQKVKGRPVLLLRPLRSPSYIGAMNFPLGEPDI